MRPRPRLRWLYRSGALPAVEYGEFSSSGNKDLRRRSSSGHHTGGIRRPQDAGWLGGSAERPGQRLRPGPANAGQHRAGGNTGTRGWPTPQANAGNLRRTGRQFPSDPLVLQWQDAAWQRMWHALDPAFGGLPPDLEAEPLVMRGNPGPVRAARASATRAFRT